MIELGGIVVLGIIAQWIAWKLKVPAILPLIIIGLVVGPLSTLWTQDGLKLISPVWDGSHGLFPGESLFHFVELSIGIILFEGGLSLKRNEIRDVGETIVKLISLGALVTFAGAALLAHFIIGLNWSISFLFAALIIVTGPTVIAPILRNVPLSRNVSTVLKWEGILIDPIGALAAVLVYEFISTSGHEESFTTQAVVQFVQIVLASLSLGTLAALSFREMLKREWIPHYLLTIFTLAFVLALFIGSGIIVPESGLLTVVVCGMIMGNIKVPHIEEITYFKESLSILLISILFILLAANIDMEHLRLCENWETLIIFLLIVLVLRPLSVFLSTSQSSLKTNEKLFISWVGPRGIVAAGIASLFGLKLTNEGFPDAEYITPLVFMVVLGTVLLNATTARAASKILKVALDTSNGIIIIGATRASRLIAKYLQDHGDSVVLVDNNKSHVQKSLQTGLNAIQSDIYGDELMDNLDLNDVGIMMALTSSNDVNNYALHTYQDLFGENGAYRLVSADELENPQIMGSSALFSADADFININEIARDFPNVHEVPISNIDQLNDMLFKIDQARMSIPLFIRNDQGKLNFIPALRENLTASEKDILVYMGQDIDLAPS
jgi:NhaP-type Na+/H+ or K+/H+ antiporter